MFNKKYIICFLLIQGSYWLGGYAHEGDLIRHCKQENTLHLWRSDDDVVCTISAKDKPVEVGELRQ